MSFVSFVHVEEVVIFQVRVVVRSRAVLGFNSYVIRSLGIVIHVSVQVVPECDIGFLLVKL